MKESKTRIIPPWEDAKSECFGCINHSERNCNKCTADTIAEIKKTEPDKPKSVFVLTRLEETEITPAKVECLVFGSLDTALQEYSESVDKALETGKTYMVSKTDEVANDYYRYFEIADEQGYDRIAIELDRKIVVGDEPCAAKKVV